MEECSEQRTNPSRFDEEENEDQSQFRESCRSKGLSIAEAAAWRRRVVSLMVITACMAALIAVGSDYESPELPERDTEGHFILGAKGMGLQALAETGASARTTFNASVGAGYGGVQVRTRAFPYERWW